MNFVRRTGSEHLEV